MDERADPVRSRVGQMKNDAGQRDGRQAEQWRQAEEIPHPRSRGPFPTSVALFLTNLFIALDSRASSRTNAPPWLPGPRSGKGAKSTS